MQDWWSGSYISRNEVHWFCKTSCTFWHYRVVLSWKDILFILRLGLDASYVINAANYKSRKQIQNWQVYQDEQFHTLRKSIHKIKDWPCFARVTLTLSHSWQSHYTSLGQGIGSGSTQTTEGLRPEGTSGNCLPGPPPCPNHGHHQQVAQGHIQQGFAKSGFVFFAPTHQVVIFIDEIPLSSLSSPLKFFSDSSKGLNGVCL